VLSVDRLIANRPCWQRPGETGILKKKTLVINDPGAGERYKNQRLVATERLKVLQKEGFNVYINQDGEFSELTDTELPSSLPQIHNETLTQEAIRQLNLTHDEILILNHQEIDDLIAGNDDDWRNLRSFQQADLTRSNISGTSLRRFLSEKGDEIETLDLSGCINLQDASLDGLKLSKLKSLVVGSPDRYRTSNLSVAAIIQLIMAGKTTLESVDLSSIPDIDDVLQALTELPSLKSLHLRQFGRLLNWPYNLNFAALETLDLTDSQIEIAVLEKMSMRATNLKTLITNTRYYLDDDFLGKLNLASMEILNLGDRKPSDDTLYNILTNALNLKTLTFDPWTLNFATLETLKQLCSPISNRNLGKILTLTKTLKTLELLDCELYGDLPDNLNLASLEHLNLMDSPISLENLVKLLANSPNLKILSLQSWKNLDNDLPDNLYLASLETLNLSCSNVSKNNVHNILKHAKHLKTLILSECRQLPVDLFDNFNFSSLETLELGGVNIGYDNLGKLLTSASKLKKLTLNDCQQLDIELPDILCLASLEELCLSESNISAVNFCKIMKSATNLKKLSFATHANLTDNVPENSNLGSINDLSLYCSNISSDNLGKLLTHAINLESLNLSRCVNLIGNLPNGLTLPSLKNLNVYKSGIKNNNLLKLVAGAQNLETLDIYECSISEKTIKIIQSSHPNIQITGYDPLPSLTNNTSPLQQKPVREQWLDADTTPDPEKTFDVDRMFNPCGGAPVPEIALYRLQAFNAFDITQTPCLIDHAFTLKNASPDLQLEPRAIPKSRTNLYTHLNNLPKISHEYYGKQTIQLTSEWQALPSLSPNETMTQYHLSHDAEVDIHYSLRDNFYYIRSKPGSTPPKEPISIDFIVEIPVQTIRKMYFPEGIALIALGIIMMMENKNEGSSTRSNPFLFLPLLAAIFAAKPTLSWLKTNVFPDDIQKKINTYSAFQSHALKIATKNSTGQDYLNALNQQQVGACRHRTFLFKAWMHEHHSEIPVRIINNECHSFIEYKVNNQWQTCNLGGYAAQLVIKEPVSPPDTSERIKELTKTEFAPESPYFEFSESSFEKSPLPVSEIPPPALAGEREDVVHFKLAELTTEGTIKENNPKQYFPAEKHEKKPESTTAYIHGLLSNNHPCTLIKANNPDKIEGLRYHLQKQCKSISRPCFYVHSPEDLVCQAPWIKLTAKNTGMLKKGPGGKLHDFLVNHLKDGTKPLLIVNYEQFTPADMVKFNALLDDVRKADDILLPDKTQVIGLINPAKPGAYDGADFYSRFDHRETCLLSEEQLEIPRIISDSNQQGRQKNKKIYNIELYGGSTWEERLLGFWSLDGQSLRFNEGELVKALNTGNTRLNLSNAPWGNPAFECFWQTALLNGFIQTQGKTIKLPENMTLSKSQGYHVDHARYLNKTFKTSTKTYVLNPGLMARLLGKYRCKHGAVYQKKGLIEAHAGKQLSLFVSHELSDAAWSQILNACKQHKVKLNLTLAHGVELPKGFNVEIKPAPAPVTKNWAANVEDANKTAYISTTDIDATLASMKTDYDLIIDVSEVDPADLILKINAQFDDKTLAFHFDGQIGALLKALRKKQNVILKGHFREDMQHALSDVIYQRQNDATLTSRLMLVGTEPDLFNTIPTFTHTVTLDDKKSALPDHHNLDDELINTKSLAELKAIARYPSQDVTAPWNGMETSPLKTVTAPASIDLSNTADKVRDFNKQRIDAVNLALNNSPFVFLAGMSGVGKTSFIKNIFPLSCDAKEHKLHIGEDKIKVWASDKTPGMKILFIDEANLSSRQWSEFEGLFNKPRAILVGNEYIRLTPEHKVIFAGNPLSYGGERQMPALFKRHGNSVVFDPMPPEYVYHEMLEPALNASWALAVPILNVADFLTTCSEDNVLITPRELVSMALFTQCYCADNPDRDPSAVAQFYAYNLAKDLVPDAFRDEFEKKFKTAEPIRRVLPNLLNADFLSTTSNQPAQQALEDFLSLRRLRQTQPGNAIQQYGGLGGLIFEGEPGIGKTELVTRTLVEHGLIKGELNDESVQKQVFYTVPAGMMYEEKKRLLLKAFHEGSVVVMDEINSAPMMESLLNDLLMGQTPDGKPPENPGFLLIGTQNPHTLAGRAKASTALQRRMQTVILPEYKPEEMIRILQHKGLPENTAKDMIHQYLERRQEAERNPDIPRLCFRDVLKRAKMELCGTEVTVDKVVTPSFKAIQNRIKAIIEMRHHDDAGNEVKSGVDMVKRDSPG